MSEEARKAREVLGLPVLSIAEGRRLGDVNTLLVRREDRCVAAIGVSGGTLGQTRHIPFSHVRTIGPEAVMVESEAALETAVPPEQVRGLDNNLPGRAVVTQSGQRVGEILGFRVNITSGQIESYRIRPEKGTLARLAALVRHDEVALPDVLAVTLGNDALIVRDEALSLLQPDVGPQAVDSDTEIEPLR